jgi:hypothetical protein
MTLPTTADVDVELAVDRLTWDLDLILVIDMGWLDRTPTVGAGIGQERLVDFVDLFGGRWLAVGLGAIVLARLAAGLVRIKLGLSLGEGSGLALAGAGCLVELAAEAFVLGLKVVDLSL